MERENSKMETDKDRMETEKSKIETEKNKMEIEKEEKNKMERENSKMETDKDRMETEKSKMEIEKQRMEKEKNEIEREKDRLEREKDRLEAEKNRIETEINKMEIEKKRIEREKLKIEIEKNRMEIERNKIETGKNRMKFSSLPDEIKELVFNYLPPDDLWTCLGVCREWRSLAGRERIWRKICIKQQMDLNYFEDDEIPNLTLCKHALLWKCNNETFMRWHSNTFLTRLIPYDMSEEITCTRIFVFKRQMALISDKIQIFSFTKKACSCENVTLPFMPHAVTMNNRYMVSTYGNVALVHKKGRIFNIYCAFALSPNMTLDIKNEKIKSFIENKHRFGPYIKTEALVADYLWISCLNNDTHAALLIINLKSLTVMKTNVVSKLLSVTNQRVIVSTHDNLYIFNFKGDVQFKLGFTCLFRATDHFIVTFQNQGGIAKVWNMNGGVYVQTLPGLSLFKLDPSRHLIYSCQRGESETDCKLSAVSLKTGVLAWFTVMRDVKLSEIDDMFLVCDKFLVVDVYIDMPTPNFHFGLIFDLDARTLLYKTYLKGFTMFVSSYLWVQKRQNDLIVNIY